MGSRFGAFEIVGQLGAGAMGEVYRARDTRLGREVALKVLPASVLADRERLARFDREARVLAALSHPNIGAIYGIEDAGGRRGLVLELVEGPTLADRLVSAGQVEGRSGLPVAEAVAIAMQIAAAIEAAHDRGITHRDLKPANVKVGERGLVKVLDFGLARSDADPRAAADGLTRTSTETESGTILGTPRYMSPEQARGEVAGAQADIWAFGCVLFEMLAGRPAFDGPTLADTLAAVLGAGPDWSLLPAGVGDGLRRVVRRCLSRDRHERWHHIGDVRIALEEAASPSGPDRDGTSSPPPRVSVDFRRLTDSAGLKEHPALSPDGKMVAFTAVVQGHRQIWIQLVAGGPAMQLTRDGVDHHEPRWSPDGSRLIFHRPEAGGSIWGMAALGGAPRRLVSAVNNGDLSHDGRRLAFFRGVDGRVELVVTTLAGGAESVVASWPAGPTVYRSPRWSPDDRVLAFTRESFAAFETLLLVAGLDGGAPRPVVRADWIQGHTWRPDGTLIYSGSTGSTMPYPPVHNLHAVTSDGRASHALTFGDDSYLQPDVRPGALVAARARSRSDIWLFPVDGTATENTRRATRLTHQTGHVQAPSISPDGGEFVYVSDHGGHSNLWVSAADGTDVRQITFERDVETVIGIGQWSPRGDWIAYISATRGRLGLRLVAPDGSGDRLLVVDGFGASWSPDGSWVYFGSGVNEVHRINVDDGRTAPVRSGTGPCVARDDRALHFVTRVASPHVPSDWDVWRAEPEEAPGTPIGRISGRRLPFSPKFTPHMHESPDGQWLALPLTDGETTNIWLMPTRGGAARQITDFGDRATLIVRWVNWTPDGRHIAAAVAETDTDIVWLDGLP